MGLDRRKFVQSLSAGSLAMSYLSLMNQGVADPGAIQEAPTSGSLPQPLPEESVVSYVIRVSGGWKESLYKQLLGAANDFKEGDAIVGVAAQDQAHRDLARTLLHHTRLGEIDAHPPLRDDLYQALMGSLDAELHQRTSNWTLGELKAFLLDQDEAAIHSILPGLSSDVIGCVVKLMNNAQLEAVGAKVFNPLPGSSIGAKGYLGARIQPNSPTDHPDDIRWQVLCGWSFAVGDVLLGTNPVSSEVESVAAVQRVLQDLLVTFGVSEWMPHCVLSHIDVQSEAEWRQPGSTALWFQSIAGSDSANATFDVRLERMQHYARTKEGPFGFYFETGQGADFTNGHDHGFDMVLHESRKYGFARLLAANHSKSLQDRAIESGSQPDEAWVHLNDVAGFIGPEVFRTREQLVRCCLEDIVMGKLHGLCIGLDVCSTLHMDVSLDDLDWCLDRLAPAGPAYLMALPTKIDPMLGYLSTGFQDHVRLRKKYGLKVNDRMWDFFRELGVIDQQGEPTEHFGDPVWVYLQYCRRQGDGRSEKEIIAEGEAGIEAVTGRGVFLPRGHGGQSWELEPELSREIRRIYSDSKQSIWAEFDEAFFRKHSDAVHLSSCSTDREDYILHPSSGEQLSEPALRSVQLLRDAYEGRYNVQLVISDGLNALSIMDDQQLQPFLQNLRAHLDQPPYLLAPQSIVIQSGRVRAGYQIGELLYGGTSGSRAILHLIGERPGSGHRTFSVYFTCCDGSVWSAPGKVDHDRTKVVAGIANTALEPSRAAKDVARILTSIWEDG